jgi:hypothetical protein
MADDAFDAEPGQLVVIREKLDQPLVNYTIHGAASAVR